METLETNYDKFGIDVSDFPDGLPEEVIDMFEPEKHRRDVLVEDCYILSLSAFGRGLLRPINPWTEDYPKPLDLEIKPEGRSGSIILVSRRGKLKIDYSVDLEEPPVLNLFYSYRNCGHTQAVDLIQSPIIYGVRPYFRCLCGYKGNCLYLAPNQYSFMCRRCAGLFYESTTINRNSTVGGLGYLLFKILKLDEQKAKIKRWGYGKKPTKKVRRLFGILGQYTGASMAQKVKTGEIQV
jgi:hypothetical protein